MRCQACRSIRFHPNTTRFVGEQSIGHRYSLMCSSSRCTTSTGFHCQCFSIAREGTRQTASKRLVHIEKVDVQISRHRQVMSPATLCSSHVELTLFQDEIRDYFGDNVAFYFAFLEHYTKALVPTALLGKHDNDSHRSRSTRTTTCVRLLSYRSYR
jgi:hypothetical protein